MRTLVAVVLAAAAALGAEYTAWPAGGASTGWVSDSIYDPIVGDPCHHYAKGTGDIIYGWKYHNLLDPTVNRTWDGWVKYSLEGLPNGAEVTEVVASHYVYDWAGTVGGDKVLTALDADPMNSGASALWSRIENGTALSQSRGGLLWIDEPLNAAGRAHVAASIERGWVALGFRYSGSRSGVISRISKVLGHGGGDYRPYLTITYSTTGMAEQEPGPVPSRVLTVEPSPVTGGRATLRYSLPKAGAANISVFDVTGRTVLSRSVVAIRSGAVSLNVGELAAGTYLVRFEADGFTGTQKLVVQR